VGKRKHTHHTGGNGETKTFQLVCVSDPKEIGRVESFLKEVNKVAKLDDGTFYRLLVASTEAVNNGIVHGNKLDVSKRVCITCTLKPGALLVKVQDEGGGFDADNLPDPLAEENLLKESGRGIFLMRSMMDKVEFKHDRHGTVVLMTINLRRLG
jgi:serine/threonine-protein kinase RsbW